MKMRYAILCAAALLAVPAFADEVVVSNGSDTVRLSDKPCTSEQVLKQLPSSVHHTLKAASAVVEGHEFIACWRLEGNLAHLLYEDGDQGLIPVKEFRETKAV
jgi:hypothetical protein